MGASLLVSASAGCVLSQKGVFSDIRKASGGKTVITPGEVGDGFFERGCLVPRFLDLGARRLPGRVARQPLLAGLREFPFGTLLRNTLSGRAFDQL